MKTLLNILVLAALLLCSCRTGRTTTETTTTDSLRTVAEQKEQERSRVADTLLVRDTVLVTIEQRGDTIWRDRVQTRWRDRVVHETDTLVVERTDTIERIVQQTTKIPSDTTNYHRDRRLLLFFGIFTAVLFLAAFLVLRIRK